ncbi:ROK family protein [Kitasatospora sp. NBC_00240]|uniref:ROK family protein n=1 Tax=Kitasatospora sp. NBC_00240 TaxID=2903567 RepID=UPI00224FEF55|nr:ROK family protein [Kitasatospora sp. NBC_00240]MCX5214514.1 ROK family protein [Kitasatospora sp. NBC_00240]
MRAEITLQEDLLPHVAEETAHRPDPLCPPDRAPEGQGADQVGEGPVVIALEVGGAQIEAVAMAADGSLLHSGRRPTRADRGPDAVLETVLDYAGELSRRYAPSAAGIAVPGLVGEAAGTSVFAAHLGWRHIPVRRWLAEELEIPVAFGHDVRAGGLAEARLGAGRACRSFLFVPVGHGIAASMVLDGRTTTGGGDFAGELGHLVIRPGGDPCPCGGAGCLETVASTAAIARRYRLATGEEDVTAEAVQRRAKAGDPTAAGIWREAVEALADGLSSAISLVAPERIVVAGALARAGRSYFDPLQAELSKRLAFQKAPRVVPSRLGRQAGVLGAALLAQQLHLTRQAAARQRLGQRTPVSAGPLRLAAGGRPKTHPF